MARLTILAALTALALASPVRADPVETWAPYVAEASARFGIPPDWINTVIRAESGGRTTLNGRPIVSRAGAMGLMQLMPATWAAMRARLGLGRDPHAPRDNILAGTLYLRLMYDRFGYPGLFGAYNAGPGRYAEHLAAGRALPSETRAYLVQTSGARVPPHEIARRPVNGIFFALAVAPRGPSGDTSDRPPLFVALRRARESPSPTAP